MLRTLIIGAIALLVLAPASVARADPSLSEIEAQLEKSGDELEDTVEAYNKVTEDLAATQATATELQSRLQPLADNMAAANANVDQFAVVAFENSSQLRNIAVLLNAESSNTLVDQLSTLQQISRHQQRQITEYAAAKSKLDEQQKKLDETLAAQNAQKAELETKKKKIEGDVKKLEDLKRKATAAGSTKTAKPATPTGSAPQVSGKAGIAVQFAWNQLGKPYKWGAAGPSSYDCSGLTMAAWKAAGITLPHNAAQQYYYSAHVAHISRSQLAPGDLVFYRNLGHMGIYIGNGQIIHAPTTGDVVRLAPVDRTDTYGYGRVH